MAYPEADETPNDCADHAASPNDHFHHITSSKAASRAAEKAKKEAAEAAIAQARINAERDARDLKAAREEINQLQSELGELTKFREGADVKTNESKQSFDAAISLKDTKIHSLTLELEAAVASNAVLQTKLDSLESQVSKSNDLVAQLDDKVSTRDKEIKALGDKVSQQDKNITEQTKKSKEGDDAHAKTVEEYKKELYQPDHVMVLYISWGGRDLTRDAAIVSKVRQAVTSRQEIQFTNDFFGCDPQPRVAKTGYISFKRRGGKLTVLEVPEYQARRTD